MGKYAKSAAFVLAAVATVGLGIPRASWAQG